MASFVHNNSKGHFGISVSELKLYKIYKNPLPQRFFGMLCRNLQFYANRPASAGLHILQNLQNLRFFANFTSFQLAIAKFAIFLHFFVMQIPPISADLRILQNLRFFAVNNKTQKRPLKTTNMFLLSRER